MSREIVIKNPKEAELIASLEKRMDIKAERIKRLLKLPDLTKKANSPVKFLFDEILNVPRLKNFDIVDFPKIVTVAENFDLLNAPKDHPSRRETDTYYLDENYILRTQMTVMWSYYLKDKEVLARLEKDGEVMALSKGIVFRKDEIDRHHFPAFHQIDGLYLCKKSKKIITLEDLEAVQIDMAKSVLGDKIEYKFLVDSFPFTTPSVEMDVMFNGDWMEVNGAGLVHPQVLKKFGLDPEVYTGWAFGFGDRLAMIKMEIPDIRILWSDDPRITSQFKDINCKYKDVSKYPETTRDISFIIDKNINLNNYFEIVRDFAENIIEEVKLIDEYEDAKKFGADKKSYTFRITYRSHERTLTGEEVNKIQDQIIAKTKTELQAVVR
jgi:phenylalanyl-tRNA synthetase alpha chain